jgi:hypothetical protein
MEDTDVREVRGKQIAEPVKLMVAIIMNCAMLKKTNKEQFGLKTKVTA